MHRNQNFRQGRNSMCSIEINRTVLRFLRAYFQGEQNTDNEYMNVAGNLQLFQSYRFNERRNSEGGQRTVKAPTVVLLLLLLLLRTDEDAAAIAIAGSVVRAAPLALATSLCSSAPAAAAAVTSFFSCSTCTLR